MAQNKHTPRNPRDGWDEALRRLEGDNKRQQLAAIVAAEEAKSSILPPGFLRAVAMAESKFNAGAKSGAGAGGIMQFMPDTAASYGVKNVHNVQQSVAGARKYLEKLYTQFDGDLDKTIAAYNWGENRKSYGDAKWDSAQGVALPKETRKYIPEVRHYLSYFSGGKDAETTKPMREWLDPSKARLPNAGEPSRSTLPRAPWDTSAKSAAPRGKELPAAPWSTAEAPAREYDRNGSSRFGLGAGGPQAPERSALREELDQYRPPDIPQQRTGLGPDFASEYPSYVTGRTSAGAEPYYGGEQSAMRAASAAYAPPPQPDMYAGIEGGIEGQPAGLSYRTDGASRMRDLLNEPSAPEQSAMRMASAAYQPAAQYASDGRPDWFDTLRGSLPQLENARPSYTEMYGNQGGGLAADARPAYLDGSDRLVGLHGYENAPAPSEMRAYSDGYTPPDDNIRMLSPVAITADAEPASTYPVPPVDYSEREYVPPDTRFPAESLPPYYSQPSDLQRALSEYVRPPYSTDGASRFRDYGGAPMPPEQAAVNIANAAYEPPPAPVPTGEQTVAAGPATPAVTTGTPLSRTPNAGAVAQTATETPWYDASTRQQIAAPGSEVSTPAPSQVASAGAGSFVSPWSVEGGGTPLRTAGDVDTPPYQFYFPRDEQQAKQVEKAYGAWDYTKDLLGKVVSGIPQAVSDLISVGGMFPGLEKYADAASGFFDDAARVIEGATLSARQLGKEKEFSALMDKHKGDFKDQLLTALQYYAENPSQIGTTVAGSLASMYSGGKAGSLIKKGAARLGVGMSATTGASIGEGVQIAGGVAHNIGLQGGDAYDRLYGIPAGAGGAIISYGTGRLLGGSDVDVALAGRLSRGESVDLLTPLRGTRTTRALGGFFGEGFEESGQSLLETAATNLGLGRDVTEGMGGALGTGFVTGSAMGGGFALRRPGGTYTKAELDSARSVMASDNASEQSRVQAADFVRRAETYELGEEPANRNFNDYLTNMFKGPPPLATAPAATAQPGAQPLEQVETAWAPVKDMPGLYYNAKTGVYEMRTEGEVANPGREMERGEAGATPQMRRVTTRRAVPGVPGVTVDESGVFHTTPAGTPETTTPPSSTATGSPGAATAGAGAFSSTQTAGTATGNVPLNQQPGAGIEVTVNGKKFTLTPEQKTAWDELDAKYSRKVDLAKKGTFTEGEKIKRAAGLQRSAGRRKLVGALTAVEQRARDKFEASVRPGDRVTTTKNGKVVTGTVKKVAFGTVTFTTDAGVEAKADYSDVSKQTATSTPKVETKQKKEPLTADEQKQLDAALEESVDLDTETDQKHLTSAIHGTNRSGNVSSPALEAAVQSSGRIKAPGVVKLAKEKLARIRDAVLRKSAKVAGGTKAEQGLVTALRKFAAAHEAMVKSGGNLFNPSKDVVNTDKVSTDRVKKHRENVQAVQDALREVGQAVYGKGIEGSAKDIEAIVRVIKDSVQAKVEKLRATTEAGGKINRVTEERIKWLQQLDARLSSAWNAAKRETFMQELSDLADVSGTPLRASNEAAEAAAKEGKTALSPLEKAATEGIKDPNGVSAGDKLTGLMGVLQYLRFHTTTPMGRILSAAVNDALRNSTNPPNLVFIDEGTSRFDPSENTVYLNRNEQSPEVVIHEAFHAALQWFVHTHKDDAEVAPIIASLQESLNAAVAAEGLTGQALVVQNKLKDLIGENRGLDAILELISYNNTLNEFRKEMQKLEAKDNTSEFVKTLKSMWKFVVQVVQKMLGVRPTVASNIMTASLALLDKASQSKFSAKRPAQGSGSTLFAEAKSDPNGQSPVPGLTNLDFSTYRNQTGWFKLPTTYAFELLGFGKDAMGNDRATTAAIKTKLNTLAEKIRREFPKTEQFLGMMDSKFSVPGAVQSIQANYTVNSQVPLMEMERLVEFVRAHKEHAKSVIDYMDGDTKALQHLNDNRKTERVAAALKTLFDRAIANLPEKERALFEGRKFSDYLIYPDTPEGLAGVGLGMRNLGRVLGMRTETEPNIDAFIDAGWIDGQYGVKTLDNLYKVTQELQDGTVIKAGYISKSIYEKTGAPKNFSVDTSALWKMTTPKDGQYRFTTSVNTKQALELGDMERLGNAMLNTAAALLHRDASRNMLDQMAEYGREDGEATANTIAFDSVKEINDTYKGRSIAESDVLDMGNKMAASPMVRNHYRRTGTWVRMPKGDDANATYGALAGKIIPGPVWNNLMDMHDRQPFFSFQALNDAMQFYKDMKTTKNPATHVTNIASNIVLSYMHDIPFLTVAKAARLYALYEVSPSSLNSAEMDMVQAFMTSGAMLGSYTTAEAKQALHRAFIKATSPDADNSTLTRLKSFAAYQSAKAALTKINGTSKEIYAAEDNIFRLAALMNVAGNIQFRDKTSQVSEAQLREAGLAARKMFLDYDINSPLVRAARQSALPFISWTYAVLPMMGRMAIEKPWAFANVTLALMLLTAAMGGADDEKKRKIDKRFGERAFGSWGPYMHVRIPFLGDDKHPVYMNLGKYIPFFSVFQPPQGNAKVAGMDWIPGFLAPSGPFANLYAILGMGVDPFTGKSIHEPTDTDLQKLGNVAVATYDTMAPPALASRNAKKVNDLLDNKRTITGRDPDTLFIARALGGMSIYQYDEQEARMRQMKDVQRIQNDFVAAMQKSRMNEYRKGYPDYAASDAEIASLRERMLEAINNRLGRDNPEEE